MGIDTSKVAVKSAPTPNDLSFVDFRNRSESIFLDPGRLYIYRYIVISVRILEEVWNPYIYNYIYIIIYI